MERVGGNGMDGWGSKGRAGGFVSDSFATLALYKFIYLLNKGRSAGVEMEIGGGVCFIGFRGRQTCVNFTSLDLRDSLWQLTVPEPKYHSGEGLGWEVEQ